MDTYPLIIPFTPLSGALLHECISWYESSCRSDYKALSLIYHLKNVKAV